MAFASFTWPFRRRGSGGGGGCGGKPATAAAEEGEEELGVTPQLLDFLRTLSPDRHLQVLSPPAPRRLRGGGHGRPHRLAGASCRARALQGRGIELRAIQKEKVRRMATEHGKPKDAVTVAVEMQESKCRESQTFPVDSESHDA